MDFYYCFYRAYSAIDTFSLIYVLQPPNGFEQMEIVKKVEFVCNQLKSKELFPPLLPTMESSDRLALMTIRLFEEFHFDSNTFDYGIVDNFNKNLAIAETDDVKSIIFFKRGKYLFKHRFYREAEVDFERAFVHGPLEYRNTIVQMKRRANRLKKICNVPNRKFHQDPEPLTGNAIKLTQNDRYGKHIVATKNIKAGDVLIVEQSFSTIVNNSLHPICHECFQRCYNLLPCDNCIHVFYCCNECKSTAWENYHKYMCPLMATLVAEEKIDAGVILALKMAIQYRHEYQNIAEIGDLSSDFGEFLKFGNSNNAQYDQLLSGSCLTAIFYEWLMKHTDFFKDTNGIVVNKSNFMKVMFTLLFTTQQCFPITQFRGIEIDDRYLQVIGCALYKISSFFNHSCCPNVYQTCHGSTIVTRAIRSIKAGEQCFLSYRISYLDFTKPERQWILLGHFKFECKCKACVGDWPKLNIDINDALKMYDRFVIPGFMNGNVEAAKRTLQNLLKEFGKIEHKEEFDKNVVLLQGLIRVCYDIFGNSNFN